MTLPLLPKRPDQARFSDARAVAGIGGDAAATGYGAWNPLPFARRCMISMPIGSDPAPRAFIDENGARFPAQIAGSDVLMELPLGALECRKLQPLPDPVAGCHWEVSARVIDNGHVRAELDDAGCVERLCVEGEFIALAGPLAQSSVTDAAKVSVIECGPVRARVLAQRGNLRLTYTLLAHDIALRVDAAWSGSGELRLAHPTQHVRADLILGENWAALRERGGRGLAAVNGGAWTVSNTDGSLLVRGNALTYALTTVRSACDAGFGLMAQGLAVSGCPGPGASVVPAFRWSELGGIVPTWIRKPDGWRGEVSLREEYGRQTRAYFYPTDQTVREMSRMDAKGFASPVDRTPEGDGFQIDVQAGEAVNLRWR